MRLVAELKHAAYFASIGSPLEPLLLGVLDRAGWGDDARLAVESFELTALQRLRRDGLEAPLIYLLEASGAPADRPSSPYSAAITDAGLDALGGQVQGISVDKKVLLGAPDAGALVARAHERGLLVYSWTLRPENRFLTARHRSVGRAGSIGHWRAEFSEIFDSGVDGVFADHPDLAIEVRDGAREPSA